MDLELANEGFTYDLASGSRSSVHVEQVLEYHGDPGYLRDRLLYKLTLEARTRIGTCGLSRLETSPAQFYRLLDTTNRRKSVDKMPALLHVLDCEVDLVVRGWAFGLTRFLLGTILFGHLRRRKSSPPAHCRS